MEYLNKETIISINNEVNGQSTIINEGALDNAVEGPKRTFAGQEIYTTIAGKVYALALPIAQNHPFQDGNKRTATKAVNRFLALNNYEVLEAKQELLRDTINRLADKDPIEEEDFEKVIAEIVSRRQEEVS